ncbi:ribonuclease E/G [Pikeienuella sp. HZG-20]|uniref:ribonuclease E/G n=1 Tax=Paludibacillus litoralis TaxID=3133267 RepID=UPI0030EF48FB
MKGRLIAIEPGPPIMAALVVEGRIEDLLIEPPADEEAPRIEEIHRVRVRRVLGSQGAALVKLAGGVDGYLREAPGVAEGDLALAEVTGFAERGKAVPLTARRLHRGRFAILTPLAEGVNVARAVKDREERARLCAIGEAALEGAKAGLILRSAAVGADEAEIRAEIEALMAREAALAAGGPPGRLAAAPDAAARALREWDAEDVIREPGAFDRLGLWDEIDRLRSPRVDLTGGGWMAVEPTAALIAVDVNTGGDLSNAAAARANLAAAADLPRQLRIRGLGGQIAVDFAPMRKTDRKAVESALRQALSTDPVRTTVAGWTPLGHLELSRKRERRETAPLTPDV